MAKKRIKVSAINLFGPALIFVVALFAVEYGYTSLAAFVGILGVVTWVIGALHGPRHLEANGEPATSANTGRRRERGQEEIGLSTAGTAIRTHRAGRTDGGRVCHARHSPGRAKDGLMRPAERPAGPVSSFAPRSSRRLRRRIGLTANDPARNQPRGIRPPSSRIGWQRQARLPMVFPALCTTQCARRIIEPPMNADARRWDFVGCVSRTTLVYRFTLHERRFTLFASWRDAIKTCSRRRRDAGFQSPFLPCRHCVSASLAPW